MPDITNDPVLIATRGLIAFRDGKIELGRKDYAQAVDLMKATRNSDTLFRCYSNWFYEEVRAGSLTAEEVTNLLIEFDMALQKLSLIESSKLVWATFRTQISNEQNNIKPNNLHIEPQMLLNLENF